MCSWIKFYLLVVASVSSKWKFVCGCPFVFRQCEHITGTSTIYIRSSQIASFPN